MKQSAQLSSGARMALAALVLAMVAGSLATAGTFTEPSTVVYGRVLGVGSERPFLLTEGALEWTIRRADGKAIVLQGGLYPANKGTYSYRLNVPHEALSLGLTASDRAITLAAAPSTNTHLTIKIDGEPATILGPAGAVFDADQLRRAATYRMDLLVDRAATDTDGDGIPDWWEERYGLDPQDNADAGLDPNGDGLSNLDCYLNGSDPTRDARIPVVLPAEIRAYRFGWTGIRVDGKALDVDPTNLFFELRAAPSAGVLLLRNAVADGGAAPDAALGVGSAFSQQDVLDGRIVYRNTSDEPFVRFDSFAVALRGAPAGEEALYRLILVDNSASSAFSLAGVEGFSLAHGLPSNELDLLCETMSRDLGCVIWDASTELAATEQAGAPSAKVTGTEYEQSYIPDFGRDRSAVMRGGLGDDRLEGGQEPDILIGGPGDDTLVGHGGGDLYVWLTPLDGLDTVEGFSSADGDVLDISRVLTGGSEYLTNYVSLTAAGTDSRLIIRPTGAVSDQASVSILVKGPELAQKGLFDAVQEGAILVGTKVMSPRIGLAVVTGNASENGPTAAELRIDRRGDIRAELDVGLQISGTAINGVDYYLLSSSVTIPAGETVVSLSIRPYVDAITEGTEYVTVTVLPGAGYTLGSATATVSIEDLLPQISVAAVRPLAVKNGTAGRFSLRRSGVTSEGIYVDLAFSGTAVAGQDYPAISDEVYFGPNVTEVRIDVAPLASAELARGKSLILTALPDSALKIMVPSAEMMLVNETLTLAQWRDRYFPTAATDLVAFAESDTGDAGVQNILRYAFGLDPQNPDPESGAPQIQLINGTFGITFRKPASVTDLNYLVMASEDLVTWSVSGLEQVPTGLDDAEMVYYRSTQPLSAAARQFILITVEKKP